MRRRQCHDWVNPPGSCEFRGRATSTKEWPFAFVGGTGLRQCLVTVYDDGFNLYYGLFRGEGCCTPYCKWLNIVELAEAICGSRDVDATIYDVRYCTAKALPTATDRDNRCASFAC